MYADWQKLKYQKTSQLGNILNNGMKLTPHEKIDLEVCNILIKMDISSYLKHNNTGFKLSYKVWH